MLYWDPKEDMFVDWEPSMGWNNSFSEQEKIAYMNLYFFFIRTRGLKENIAESLAQMHIFKEKFPSLQYSEEQELLLKSHMQLKCTS